MKQLVWSIGSFVGWLWEVFTMVVDEEGGKLFAERRLYSKNGAHAYTAQDFWTWTILTAFAVAVIEFMLVGDQELQNHGGHAAQPSSLSLSVEILACRQGLTMTRTKCG